MNQEQFVNIFRTISADKKLFASATAQSAELTKLYLRDNSLRDILAKIIQDSSTIQEISHDGEIAHRHTKNKNAPHHVNPDITRGVLMSEYYNIGWMSTLRAWQLNEIIALRRKFKTELEYEIFVKEHYYTTERPTRKIFP